MHQNANGECETRGFSKDALIVGCCRLLHESDVIREVAEEVFVALIENSLSPPGGYRFEANRAAK